MGKRQQWNISTAYLNHVVALYHSCAVFVFNFFGSWLHKLYPLTKHSPSQVVPGNCQRKNRKKKKKKPKTETHKKHTDFSQPCLWVNNFIWPFFALGLPLFCWVWHARNAVIQAKRTSSGKIPIQKYKKLYNQGSNYFIHVKITSRYLIWKVFVKCIKKTWQTYIVYFHNNI